MRDGPGAQRPLPVAPNTQNGALGEEGVHPHTAAAPHHEAPAVPAQTQVCCVPSPPPAVGTPGNMQSVELLVEHGGLGSAFGEIMVVLVQVGEGVGDYDYD